MKALTIKVFVFSAALTAAACRPAAVPSAPVPEPVPPLVPAALPASNPKLPPVPEVRGPLKISVTYPKPDQMLTVRDSNFIFGNLGTGDAALSINGVAVPVYPNGAFMGWLPVPPDNAPRYEILARNATESARLRLPIRIPPAPDTTHRDKVLGDTLQAAAPSADTVTPIPTNVYVTLGPPSTSVSDTDRVTIARPGPGNGQEYKWFLFPGTVVKITGAQKASGDDFVRIELDSNQVAWVLRSELQAQNMSPASPTGFVGDSVAPVRQAGTVRVVPGPEWIDVQIPLTGPPPPYLVEETDRTVSLLLYGVSGAPVISAMAEPRDTYFNSISSTPEPARVRYSINLNQAPYGYLALWQNGMLTFRVRRPPRIADAASSLRGLTITIDPGHPPAGATGPTSLYEADAVLEVGFKVRDMLTQRGVNVVLTRTTPDPVDLGVRPIIARRANANAFVSIHLNAFPDGVNPFVNNGTLTLYFWPQSIPLGTATQAALLAELGLRDNGTKYQNLAVARGTWMPSILTEGAFVIMPDQEAALRTAAYQTAYATAIVRGLETYFASLARTQ
jgi:N-acetylmuramoyl-L-alanine amidase